MIADRMAVGTFLEENRLRHSLLEAVGPLNAIFGKSIVKKLAVVRDDEGIKTLFCFILFPGGVQEARRALRAFDDQWWIARCEQAAGKLNFDVDLV